MAKDQYKQHLLTLGMGVFFLIILIRLFNIQIIDTQYKVTADNNALRYITKYPVRGRILDRNGLVLVDNAYSYDIQVTPYDVKPFDTLALCRIFNLSPEDVHATFAEYRKYRTRIGFQSKTFLKQVTQDQYSHFLEMSHHFPGFTAVPRTIRSYPYNAGGNLLGYVSEVDANYLKKHPEYQSGDYAGKTGLELLCEEELRGEKGYNIYLRNVHNRIQDSYREGEFDKPAVAGRDVRTTIDAELQQYGEYLMQNKVGSIVAIEPSTGEILSMVSSPGIHVSILAEIGKHYGDIASDPFKPMFNRAVMSPQPPGSVFKLVNALIGLQDGVVSTHTEHRCNDGFRASGIRVGCHTHPSPVDFRESIMMSCNAYYCELFRDILHNSAHDSIQAAFTHWRELVQSFGFGKKLGSDFPAEQSGYVPDASLYNRVYGRRGWSALSVISLSIGQGELGCTPLHLANLGAILANRGHYYIPHILKATDSTGLDPKYTEPVHTLVDPKHFEPVIDGMYRAVNSPPGSGATGRLAAADSLSICGKTGTSQNPHGDDHSVFVCFAPRENPKIAVAVYIENAGAGGSWAAPTAGLMVEKYLNREISENKKWIEDRLVQANLLEKARPKKKP